jgi:hypothetical protein
MAHSQPDHVARRDTRRACGCVRERITYWPPEHVTRSAQPLLGNPGQFCSSFFHVLPCTEFGIASHSCLREDARECHHQCVTIVARLQSDDDPLGVAARYTTCRTARGDAIHAEDFLVHDFELLTGALAPGARITIYGQVQPCHHSGGTDARPKDVLSCTELILHWYSTELTPRGIKLAICCANIYKAMWQFDAATLADLPPEKQYTVSVALARQGLELLVDAGIPVSSIDPEGWRFLTSLADLSPAEEKLDSLWPARYEADRQIETFLAGFRNAGGSPR